jgi:DNA primase
VGGDAITFIKEIENLDFMDAARALAPDAGLDIADYERNYNPEVKKTKDSLYDINRLAAGYCRDQLQQSEAASEYVHNRGLTRDLLQHFGV